MAKGGPVLMAKGGILLVAEIGILYLTIYNCFCVKQKMHFIWHFNNPPEQQGTLGITLL